MHKRKIMPLVLSFSSLLLLQGAWAMPWDAYLSNQDGSRAYQDKRYDDSLKFFEKGLYVFSSGGSTMDNGLSISKGLFHQCERNVV